MTADLTWLCGDESEMRPVIGMLTGEGDYLFWTVGPDNARVARLTYTDAGLAVNGVREEREDFYALMAAIEELEELNDGETYRAVTLTSV
jgi:hypothetical protein